MSNDRRVHATLPNGYEIVRYDRAGKWYCEHPELQQRQALTIGDAVKMAGSAPGAVVRLGQPGGGRFDGLYRKNWNA